MAKYDSSASVTQSNGSNVNSREKAKAWINIKLRTKDGATSTVGIPLMESDYVHRTILHATAELDEESRNEIMGKLLAKAIASGDVEMKFVLQRDETAVGELDL